MMVALLFHALNLKQVKIGRWLRITVTTTRTMT
jgi:hypothetical protein